jgi:uncharacterized protein (TIGR00251 family)
MARLSIKVRPRARRSGIAGRLGDVWKVDVAAPPVDGKANEECVRFFAEMANVPRGRVGIVAGESSRLKVLEIEGMEQRELEEKMGRQ